MLNSENPDLVVLTGDVVDPAHADDYGYHFSSALELIKAKGARAAKDREDEAAEDSFDRATPADLQRSRQMAEGVEGRAMKQVTGRLAAEMKSRQPKGREMAGAGREYVKPKAKTGVEMSGYHHTLMSQPMVVAQLGDEVPALLRALLH